MPLRLITTWTENDEFLAQILGRAKQSILVFDDDLAKLQFESPANADVLRRLLATDRKNRVHIVLRNADPLRRNGARLMQLLGDHPGALTIQECAPQLIGLNDSMVIVDDRHALIRFHPDNPRARTIG